MLVDGHLYLGNTLIASSSGAPPENAEEECTWGETGVYYKICVKSATDGGMYVGSGFLFGAQILLWMSMLPPLILSGWLFRRRKIWISQPPRLPPRTEEDRKGKWKKKLLKIQRKSVMMGAGGRGGASGTGGLGASRSTTGGLFAAAKNMKASGNWGAGGAIDLDASATFGASGTGGLGLTGGNAPGAGGWELPMGGVKELLTKGDFLFEDTGAAMLGTAAQAIRRMR